MTSQQIIFGLSAFFHNLFTVVWVGGLIVFTITVLPIRKTMFASPKNSQEFLSALLKRHRVWVYLSMIGLFITGILQARFGGQALNGFMKFDSSFAAVLSFKHIITLIMIIIALFRSIMGSKKQMEPNPHKMKLSIQLIYINTFLGILVLLMSGLLSAL